MMPESVEFVCFIVKFHLQIILASLLKVMRFILMPPSWWDKDASLHSGAQFIFIPDLYVDRYS
jgi:hypothetical protein